MTTRSRLGALPHRRWGSVLVTGVLGISLGLGGLGAAASAPDDAQERASSPAAKAAKKKKKKAFVAFNPTDQANQLPSTFVLRSVSTGAEYTAQVVGGAPLTQNRVRVKPGTYQITSPDRSLYGLAYEVSSLSTGPTVTVPKPRKRPVQVQVDYSLTVTAPALGISLDSADESRVLVSFDTPARAGSFVVRRVERIGAAAGPQDGTAVALRPDGRSAADDAVTRGATYTYTLFADSEDGTPLPPASVTVTVPDPAAGVPAFAYAANVTILDEFTRVDYSAVDDETVRLSFPASRTQVASRAWAPRTDGARAWRRTGTACPEVGSTLGVPQPAGHDQFFVVESCVPDGPSLEVTANPTNTLSDIVSELEADLGAVDHCLASTASGVVLEGPDQGTAAADCSVTPQAVDTDRDGLSDDEEEAVHTDPTNPDTDGDGLKDGAERTHETNPLDADTDNDLLADGEDLPAMGLDPHHPDTDADGLFDGVEGKGDDTNPDCDADGRTDGEQLLGDDVHPCDGGPAGGGFEPFADEDGDGLSELLEHWLGTDATSADSDSDGVLDGEELDTELYPFLSSSLLSDSDGDGFSDVDERDAYSDPLGAFETPESYNPFPGWHQEGEELGRSSLAQAQRAAVEEAYGRAGGKPKRGRCKIGPGIKAGIALDPAFTGLRTGGSFDFSGKRKGLEYKVYLNFNPSATLSVGFKPFVQVANRAYCEVELPKAEVPVLLKPVPLTFEIGPAVVVELESSMRLDAPTYQAEVTAGLRNGHARAWAGLSLRPFGFKSCLQEGGCGAYLDADLKKVKDWNVEGSSKGAVKMGLVASLYVGKEFRVGLLKAGAKAGYEIAGYPLVTSFESKVNRQGSCLEMGLGYAVEHELFATAFLSHLETTRSLALPSLEGKYPRTGYSFGPGCG